MASMDAMKSITSAIITTTLVFMAVFIPVSMMGGTSGTFYTQFGITMAAAVGISAVNALTLSPALCALLMRPHNKERLCPNALKEGQCLIGQNDDVRHVTSYMERFRMAFLNTDGSSIVNPGKWLYNAIGSLV